MRNEKVPREKNSDNKIKFVTTGYNRCYNSILQICTRSFQNARWYVEKYCNNLNAMSMITEIDRVLFRYVHNRCGRVMADDIACQI